jgi:hypothetical protein
MAAANKRNTKKRGRPRIEGDEFHITFRLRRGRAEAEDRLIDRLEQLTGRGQRSRYIRRVLTTGDVEPVLEREFEQESAAIAAGLDSMFDLWSIDEEED